MIILHNYTPPDDKKIHLNTKYNGLWEEVHFIKDMTLEIKSANQKTIWHALTNQDAIRVL